MKISAHQIESTLLSITHDFLLDLKAERAIRAVTLDATLDRELGIDSLGKVELLHRIEEAFSIRLPEKAMIEAETLRELSKLIAENLSNNINVINIPSYSSEMKPSSLNLSSEHNLIDILSAYASTEPNRPHLYLQNERGEEKIIHYGKLYEQAINIASGLRQKGIQLGETIAIMLPTSEDFFYAFFGVLFAGAIPVPIYPPFRPDKIEEYAKREAKILHNARVKMLITFSQAEILSKILQSFIPSLNEVTTLQNLQAKNYSVRNLLIPSNATALIQYTSGSTGDPKGVTLTHQNILANIRAIGKAIPIKSTDIAVSWLPLYHDMGLMTWLGGLYFGIPVTIMSPITFLTRPERWLWAIHYHRATISGGPNFAYELCVKKINTKDIEGLDLSSWKFAFNGAEAVNPRTMENFYKKFSVYGFDIESFAPVYGLAESTVGLTFPAARRVPLIDKVDRDLFEKDNSAIPSAKLNSKKILEFVSSGIPLTEHAIRIIDNSGNEMLDRMVGNLQFRGPSSMKGYFNNRLATQKAFYDGWWDTGDLAYSVNKEVFIVGRKKDLIIKAGRNLYPEEIEEIVNTVPNIRKGCVIAFGVNDPKTGTEKLIIVAETYNVNENVSQKIRSDVIERMVTLLDMPPDEVILVHPKTIPKTSSGKLQRSSCKKAYIEGKLIKQKIPARIQYLKLTLLSLSKKFFNWFGNVLKALYALYIGALLLITLPVIWLSIIILPRQLAIKTLRSYAVIFLKFAFCPLDISNKANLMTQNSMIFASNHQSYLDALVLLAILPLNCVFIAKKELLNAFLIGKIIKKLGYLTVDRIDFAKSVSDKSTIEQTIKQGLSVVIFPEGTFTQAPGLRPFKLGTFIIAANTATPICPITIRGTRSILRGDSFLPKPGRIDVVIAKPIFPQSKEWNEVARLHSLVREEIAQNCGESIIDIIAAGP